MKLVFMLIIYLAGFATAVHFLAQKPANQASQSYEDRSYEDSSYEDSNVNPEKSFDSQAFVETFDAGMRKCAVIAKNATVQIYGLIKEKIEASKLEKKQIADTSF